MREAAEYFLDDDAQTGRKTLALSGPLRVWSIGELDRGLNALEGQFDLIDLSRVSDIDTSGAWLVHSFAAERGARIGGESAEARRLIAAVSRIKEQDDEEDDSENLLTRTAGDVGELIMAMARGTVQVIAFLGSFFVSLGSLLRHPGRFRWNALVHQMQLIGIDSLAIIGLMSFLVGIVIANQGADNLADFGAEALTVNLTGRISLRELGILMTAIMVAGRSGSAFAAQLGTMKLTEEIDAMRTIGVSPMEALVVPRVLAAMLMMPMLGFYAAVVAIIGGAFISSFQIEIPFFTFLTRIREVVPIHDLWVGLIKAPVFGLIIAIAGCYHGMQVRGNAEEVGLRTTQAVVTAIFMVIVLDAFFAVFFSVVGWG